MLVCLSWVISQLMFEQHERLPLHRRQSAKKTTMDVLPLIDMHLKFAQGVDCTNLMLPPIPIYPHRFMITYIINWFALHMWIKVCFQCQYHYSLKHVCDIKALVMAYDDIHELHTNMYGKLMLQMIEVCNSITFVAFHSLWTYCTLILEYWFHLWTNSSLDV